MLAHGLAGEDIVPGVDSGVDQTDGLAAAGLRAGTVLQLELRVGPVRPDRRQSPLVLEVLLADVILLDRVALVPVLLRRNATEIDGLNAVWRRRWLLLRRRCWWLRR